MARFDVHRNPDGEGYVVNCQADILWDIRTRVVIPLLPPEVLIRPAKRLNPVFQIEGAPHILIPQFIASLPASSLGPVITSLADHDMAILAAIDMLVTGY